VKATTRFLKMTMVAGFLFLAGAVVGPASQATYPGDDPRMADLLIPTLGGKQFWADTRIAGGWRIQQNILTGHYRLLDEKDRRHSFGDATNTAAALAAFERAGKIRSYQSHLVILVHGILRSTGSFDGMAAGLREAGFDVQTISFPAHAAPSPTTPHS